MNYWAPFQKAEDNKDPRQINAQIKVINSGATSNFVPKDMDLLKKEKLCKELYLPDNSELQALYKRELSYPSNQWRKKTREANILQGL